MERVPLLQRGVDLDQPGTGGWGPARLGGEGGPGFDEQLGVGVLEVEELRHPVGHVDGDRRLLAPEPLLHPPRVPGCLLFVLGDTERELAGGANGVHVGDAGIREPDVHHDQAEGPADRNVHV